MTNPTKKRKFEEAPSREWSTDDGNLVDFFREERWGLSPESVKSAAAILQKHDVTTMGNLKKGMDNYKSDVSAGIYPLLDAEAMRKMVRFFATDIQPPKNPEDNLDKKLLDEGGLNLEERLSKQREFTEEAIAVKGPPTGTTDRKYDIRIVNGPSGSGKTVYAINHLASLNDDPTNNAEKGVCIYYSLSGLSPSNFEKEGSFRKAIKQVLREALSTGSDGKWDETKKKLNMRVSLILDEAGALSYILDDFTLLTQVHEEIKACSMFPRLILAGTGYDKTPKGGCSSTHMYKYRMQPWEGKNLSLVATKRYPENGDGKKFVEAIFQYPVLKRLITNARMAAFTLDAVQRLKWGHHTIELQGSIGTVVQMVIGEYIAFNAISGLYDSQRKMLAYGVFCELDLQNSNEEPRFPEFNEIKHHAGSDKYKIIRQAQGVVDLHVELSTAVGGETNCCFVDGDAEGNKQSISVTPAMSMLLYNLLGVDATIYDNWEGLEATAALHAAYLEVLTNNDIRTHGVQIARLTKAVPATGATKNIKIPRRPKTPTIFINGDKAPFFDVITKFRGIQAKYSKTAENSTLDFGKELQKCGLLKEKLPYALMIRDVVDESPAQSKIGTDPMLVDNPVGTPDEVNIKNLSGKVDNIEAEAVEETKEKERKKQDLIDKGEKEFKMGNATMAAFVHTWKEDAEDTGHSNGGNVSDDKPKKLLSPAFCFPTTGRAEKEVVPSHEYKVEEKVEKNGSVVKFPVKYQDEKIAEASFDADAPFEMIFLTNAKQMELFPKWNGKAIVIASDSVGASGEFRAGKKPDGYDEFLQQFKLKENVNIRFVFTG